jgi:oligopeptide/dipeptide ABC transporter ATP-binding protein
VAIARALAVEPDVLIADEAVSSLDVSIQAQILRLFEDLQRQLDLTVVFISHQLAVISHVSERAAVMYLGRIVEYGRTADVFGDPQHPYTRGLLDSHPEPDPAQKRPQPAVRGELPSPLAVPSGCRFRTRCAFAEARCAELDPPLEDVGGGRLLACHVRPFAAGRRPLAGREHPP